MELTNFSWRARQADSVMLGATFYDRRLEVDQLYVRQRKNELTINGELLWPKIQSGWARLPFRGHLNAVGAVAFSPDGTRLATSDNIIRGTTIIWDVRPLPD